MIEVRRCTVSVTLINTWKNSTAPISLQWAWARGPRPLYRERARHSVAAGPSIITKAARSRANETTRRVTDRNLWAAAAERQTTSFDGLLKAQTIADIKDLGASDEKSIRVKPVRCEGGRARVSEYRWQQPRRQGRWSEWEYRFTEPSFKSKYKSSGLWRYRCRGK